LTCSCWESQDLQTALTGYARGKFSGIARQINRLFPMPVMVIFKHGDRLTIAVINRRRNKLDDNKDVLEKATLSLSACDGVQAGPGACFLRAKGPAPY
jgi:hypothetical protein